MRFLSQLNKRLSQISPDVVHIQHELALFGGLATAYLLHVLLFKWHKKVTLTLHGVLGAADVDSDFVKANNYSPAPVWAVRLGLKLLYWPLAHWPRRVIVHEQFFKDTLVHDYGANPDKVEVIPHGAEEFTAMDKTDARTMLGIGIGIDKQVVLFMGYAAGYKGIDLLIQGFAQYAKNNPRAFLIIGAGEHPKLKDDPNYKKIYAGYQQKAKELLTSDQYKWVGFIPESKVGFYYSAADVSVYPYTAAMSSSGPMAFAIGYGRPFLASDAFANIFGKELIFASNSTALANKLTDFFGKPDNFEGQIVNLRQDRLWPRTSLKTATLYKQIGLA